MFRNISVCFVAFAAICASTVLASAQVSSSATETIAAPASSSPAAYVYVSSSTGAGSDQIYGYSAASNGSLTAIPGSPFPWSVDYMAVNGAWLFGVLASSQTDGGQVIDSFSIGSNGALSFASQVSVIESGGEIFSISLDHTGSSLYADYYTTNNDYLNYSVDQSTGALSYVSTLPEGPPNNSPLSFVGSNQYGYSASCLPRARTRTCRGCRSARWSTTGCPLQESIWRWVGLRACRSFTSTGRIRSRDSPDS